MSTHTQKAHYDYTIKEWCEHYKSYLNIIFKNNDINVIYDIGSCVGGTISIFFNYCKINKKKIPNIYAFEPDKENMIFLKKVLKDYIKKDKLKCFETGIYYGKKEAKVFGMGLCSEKKIYKNVGGYGLEECMIKIAQLRNKDEKIKIFTEQKPIPNTLASFFP